MPTEFELKQEQESEFIQACANTRQGSSRATAFLWT